MKKRSVLTSIGLFVLVLSSGISYGQPFDLIIKNAMLLDGLGGKAVRADVGTTELARDIGLAKAWIVVEVVNILVSRKNPQTSKYLDWFRQTLPQWAKSLSAQAMS